MFAATRRLSEVVMSERWDPRSFLASKTKASTQGKCKLGSLVREVRTSSDPPIDSGIEFPYLGLENVESVTGDLVGVTMKRGGEVKSRSKVYCGGDILFGRLRPSLAKVYWCPADAKGGYCSGEFIVLRPNSDNVFGRVLREQLASPQIISELCRKVMGAALPRVSAEDLLAVYVSDMTERDYSVVNSQLLDEDRIRNEAKRMIALQPAKLQELVWK